MISGSEKGEIEEGAMRLGLYSYTGPQSVEYITFVSAHSQVRREETHALSEKNTCAVLHMGPRLKTKFRLCHFRR